MRNLSSLIPALSAFLASLCCIGPALLAMAGIGSVGFFAVFEKWRMPLLILTILLLGIAFFLVYRRKSVVCGDGSCTYVSGSRSSKVLLWFATALSVSFLAYPYLDFGVSQGSKENGAPALNSTQIVIPIKGMTCTGCNSAVESEVSKQEGVFSVKADFSRSQATVTFDSQRTTAVEIVNRINTKTGYVASLPTTGGN